MANRCQGKSSWISKYTSCSQYLRGFVDSFNHSFNSHSGHRTGFKIRLRIFIFCWTHDFIRICQEEDLNLFGNSSSLIVYAHSEYYWSKSSFWYWISVNKLQVSAMQYNNVSLLGPQTSWTFAFYCQLLEQTYLIGSQNLLGQWVSNASFLFNYWCSYTEQVFLLFGSINDISVK